MAKLIEVKDGVIHSILDAGLGENQISSNNLLSSYNPQDIEGKLFLSDFGFVIPGDNNSLTLYNSVKRLRDELRTSISKMKEFQDTFFGTLKIKYLRFQNEDIEIKKSSHIAYTTFRTTKNTYKSYAVATEFFKLGEVHFRFGLALNSNSMKLDFLIISTAMSNGVWGDNNFTFITEDNNELTYTDLEQYLTDLNSVRPLEVVRSDIEITQESINDLNFDFGLCSIDRREYSTGFFLDFDTNIIKQNKIPYIENENGLEGHFALANTDNAQFWIEVNGERVRYHANDNTTQEILENLVAELNKRIEFAVTPCYIRGDRIYFSANPSKEVTIDVSPNIIYTKTQDPNSITQALHGNIVFLYATLTNLTNNEIVIEKETNLFVNTLEDIRNAKIFISSPSNIDPIKKTITKLSIAGTTNDLVKAVVYDNNQEAYIVGKNLLNSNKEVLCSYDRKERRNTSIVRLKPGESNYIFICVQIVDGEIKALNDNNFRDLAINVKAGVQIKLIETLRKTETQGIL